MTNKLREDQGREVQEIKTHGGPVLQWGIHTCMCESPQALPGSSDSKDWWKLSHF